VGVGHVRQRWKICLSEAVDLVSRVGGIMMSEIKEQASVPKNDER